VHDSCAACGTSDLSRPSRWRDARKRCRRSDDRRWRKLRLRRLLSRISPVLDQQLETLRFSISLFGRRSISVEKFDSLQRSTQPYGRWCRISSSVRIDGVAAIELWRTPGGDFQIASTPRRPWPTYIFTSFIALYIILRIMWTLSGMVQHLRRSDAWARVTFRLAYFGCLDFSNHCQFLVQSVAGQGSSV